MKKKVLFAAAFMLATVGAYAQGNGIAGITEATNMVTSYFDPGGKANELFITILAFIHLFSPSHAILDHIGGATKKAFFLAYQ